MTQNVHRIEGDVTYITLTRGQEAIIDTADLEHVLQMRWLAEEYQDGFYARSRSNGQSAFLHRYILGVTRDVFVQHKNGNTMDNRRGNLQVLTASEKRLQQERAPGETGLQYIHILRKPDGSQYYFVCMVRKGRRKLKSYPYTEEGLQAAQDLVAKWQKDFSYEPMRTTQRRVVRANIYTSTSSDTGPHIHYKREEKLEPSLDEESIAYVPLSRGQEAIIDVADAEKIAAYTWHATPQAMGGFYASSSIDGKTTYMHRLIVDAPDGTVVDHINHHTLDNRRGNLRICTHQENMTNRDGAFSNSKTGIRGVSVHKCKPSGLMYAFRCHCRDCKAHKFFPYTEEGLEAAASFSESHYAAMK
jgi:hypothetical protein